MLAKICSDECLNEQILIIKKIKNNFAQGCNSTLNTFLSCTVIFSPYDEGVNYVQWKTQHLRVEDVQNQDWERAIFSTIHIS